jgi:hypothetical protein
VDADLILKELSDPGLLPAERDERTKMISQYINDLLLNDFPRLVQLLYRIDVSEEMLKTTLKNNPNTEAGELIAALLVKRQDEKQAALNNNLFSKNESAEERW